MFLDSLDRYVSALWVSILDQLWGHKMECRWRQSSVVLTKIDSLWHKAFEQYKGVCYSWWVLLSSHNTGTSHESSIVQYSFGYSVEQYERFCCNWWLWFSSRNIRPTPFYSLYVCPWEFVKPEIMLDKYNALKKKICSVSVQPLVDLLYNAIRSGQVQHVALISEFFTIDEEMLSVDVPHKNINLLQYASQNREILAILEKSSRVDYMSTSDGKLFMNWYQLLNSLSSHLPLKQSVCTISKNGLDATTDENTIHNKLKDISEMTERHLKSKEKQRVINAIRKLFHRIAWEIGNLNPIFGCRPQFVGSSREGTRPFLPDEFDTLMICEAIRQYLDISLLSPELTLDEKASVTWKTECRNEPKLRRFMRSTDTGQFDVQNFKNEFDALMQKALINIFQDGVFADSLILEPQFAQYSRISNVSVIWRGNEFKDMEVNVDVVLALSFDKYKPVACPAAANSKFYVFFKMHGPDGRNFPLAHSDVELKNISSLPIKAQKGYKFVIPDHVRKKLSVVNIQDYLTTYMLKTSLFSAPRY